MNCICPGGILTPLIHRGSPDMLRDRLAKLQPWPEHGVGDHIAGAAVFLASEDARFVTGVHLPVDGGLTGLGPDLRALAGEEAARSPLANVVGVDHGSTGVPPLIRRS